MISNVNANVYKRTDCYFYKWEPVFHKIHFVKKTMPSCTNTDFRFNIPNLCLMNKAVDIPRSKALCVPESADKLICCEMLSNNIIITTSYTATQFHI